MGIRRYTDEETSDLEHIYLKVTQDIDEIAEALGRDRRSIISKLVSMNIYINRPKKEKKITSKMLIRQLEQMLDITFTNGFDNFGNINISHKQNLGLIVDAIQKIREGTVSTTV